MSETGLSGIVSQPRQTEAISAMQADTQQVFRLWAPGQEPQGSTAVGRRGRSGPIVIDSGPELFTGAGPEYAGLDGGSLFSEHPDQLAFFDAGLIE